MLKQKRLLLLWLALQLSLFLLLQEAIGGWVSLIFAALLVLRLVTVTVTDKTLSLKLVNILAALCTAALLVNLKQAGVLHFMLQILLLAAILRLLALRQLYEARQLVWVHYFLIGCCFILHQDMLLALIIMLALLANIYSHFILFAPTGARLNLPRSGRAVLIILPLWLGMFLLFPRLPPFWQIPTANVASTGLSDTLDPGSIEQLVQDDSLAFRVEFNRGLPNREQLYWRARLYEDFDGRRWQENRLRSSLSYRAAGSKNTAGNSNQSIEYRIIAEASQQRSLFALGDPQQSSPNVSIAPSGLVMSVKPVSQRTSYQLSSHLQPVSRLSEEERRLNLRVPSGNNQTLAFARQLQQQYPQTPDLIAAIAEHFRQQAYFYSLTPPLLGDNSVDEFLFTTRTGFCSHYASATALLLRGAGIPARVVGGYQGGQWHSEQGYLAVRQREAHAWVEYLDQGRWQPFDPTAAVAPERILSSLDDALSPEQRQLLNLGWQNNAILNNLRQQLMHLDYYWSVWVLGFNDNEQRQLWQNLKQQLREFAAILAAFVVVLITAALGYWWAIRHRQQKAAAQLLLLRAFAGLLRQKPPQQPISVFLCHLAAQHPAEQLWLQAVIASYEQAMFNNNTAALHQLKQLLKQHRRQLRRLGSTIENT